MSALSSFLRSRPAAALLIGSVIFAAAIGLRAAGVLVPLELDAFDAFLSRQTVTVPDDQPMVLVHIGEEEINRFGHPLPDALLAQALAKLSRANPRAVGVDIYRDAPIPRDPETFAADAMTPDYRELGDVITGDPRIVMVMKMPDHEGTRVAPPFFLEGPGQVSFSDLPVDEGGFIRRGFLYIWEGETAHVSLALQLALRYLYPDGIGLGPSEDDPEAVMLGETTIPPFGPDDGGYVSADDGGYQFLLDYKLGKSSFPQFSMETLLSDDFDPDWVRDKIVLVGTMAPSVKDDFFNQVTANRGFLYGMEIHAHVVSQLVRFGQGTDHPVSSWSAAAEIAWILAWCLAGALLGLWGGALWLGAGVSILGMSALVGGSYALFAEGTWVPVVPPLFGGIGSAALVSAYVAVMEGRERRQVTQLFSRFQGSAVVEEIWRQRDIFTQNGVPRARRATLTVLISDLQGFTAASEKLGPDGLMQWISEYLNDMANLVGEHHGVVDDYAGDGIKANFGFPVPRETDEEIDEDARNSVRCAIAMGAATERLNALRRETDTPTSRVRVGIFTGQVVLGAVGGLESLKYTTVGDTVNTAARLESFSGDDFGSKPDDPEWRILVGHETMSRLGDEFRAVSIGAHAVKGKDKAVEMFRILGFAESGATDSQEEPR